MPHPGTVAGLVAEEPLHEQLSRVFAVLRESPDRPVVIGPYGPVTGADFLARIAALATELHAHGAGPGAPVAILTAGDRAETITSRYAAHLLGAPIVYLRSANARSDHLLMPAAEQERVLRAVGVRILVADGSSQDRASALRATNPALRTVHADHAASGSLDRVPVHSWHPDETAAVYLTSGTTGTPRLVPHSARGRAALVALAAGPSARDYRPVLLAVTPVSHTISTMTDAILLEGGTVVLAPDAPAEEMADALVRYGVTDMYLPVPALYRFADHLAAHPVSLASLRRVTYSGTVAAPGRIAEAHRVLGDRINQQYGSTEAGGISSLGAADHFEPLLLGSVGRPYPWVQLRIDAPPDTAGEILVRSPTVMQGYPGAVDGFSDGWLRTGDLGRLDEYGYLHLTGRVGEVVKAHGIKIYPSAVARVLCEHPAVADAAVYGVRDGDSAEHLHAAVETRGGVRCADRDLAAHVAARLTPEHVPARFDRWARLPRTESGKPDVRQLREQEVSL